MNQQFVNEILKNLANSLVEATHAMAQGFSRWHRNEMKKNQLQQQAQRMEMLRSVVPYVQDDLYAIAHSIPVPFGLARLYDATNLGFLNVTPKGIFTFTWPKDAHNLPIQPNQCQQIIANMNRQISLVPAYAQKSGITPAAFASIHPVLFGGMNVIAITDNQYFVTLQVATGI